MAARTADRMGMAFGLTADESIAILIEVVTGAPGPIFESKAKSDYRSQVTREVEEVLAQGGVIEVPYEVADEEDGL